LVGNKNRGRNIEIQSSITEDLIAPPPPRPRTPPDAFGSARAVLLGFFTGRLRKQFYSDVREFGDGPDATLQVGAGYMCLGGGVGWGVGFIAVMIANPPHIAAHIAAFLSVLGCGYGFLQIRRKRDPRTVLNWMVMIFLVSCVVISYGHSGIIAPVMASLPAVAAITTLYLRGAVRRTALVLGVLVVVFGFATASGAIGIPTTYTPERRGVMTLLTLIFSSTSLCGLAWLSNLSRDYVVEKLKEANTTVSENASRSRVALEAAKVGLWDVPDAELRKFHVSESFASITGYTAEEFDNIFTALHEFAHPEDIVQLREAFALGRKRMSRLRVDFRLKTKTRGYRWFAARAKYSINEDGTHRISGSLQDINFIKAAEEALRAGRDRAREANKAKSDFIAVMSHEVRTPLNAILGSVEVLKRGDHDKESGELIALIDDAGRGLLTIVNDLLDVSKVEAGKLEISPQPTDLAALVTRTVDFWGPQASNKGLSLKVDCSGAGSGKAMVDAGRVRQIVGNLLSNAIKFTDEGSVTATLTTHETREGRIEILISVIDTGPGIPDAVAETIFAPFEQAPSNAGRGGTGLGLFISRRLARLMGGDLTLEPARRNGSHFRLSLMADPAVEIGEDDTAGEDPLWAGKRVLCVDDNENNRRICELLLGKFGIEVTVCASGPEAIDICAIKSFDAILMDIVMPDMNGLETLHQLRNDRSCPNQATPAIALTAKLSADDIADYAAAGFDGVAGKPINVRELAQAIAPFMIERAPAANES
jgi:PAS domain S-box-containing protein